MAKKADDALFEDVPYQEAPAHGGAPDSLFEETPHPDMSAPIHAEPNVGAGRAALVGAGQGATFGFGDELTAPFVGAAAMTHDAFSKPENQVTNTLPGETTWKKYQRLMQDYRDVAREEQKAAQHQNPLAYTGGAVAGGLLTMKAPGMGALNSGISNGLGRVGQALPGAATATEMAPGLTKFFGNVAKGGIEGTGYGAAAGLGEGEGDLSDRAKSAEEMAKTGGLVGATIPVAGQALASTGKGLAAAGDIPVISTLGKNFKQGLKGNELVTGSARRAAADEVKGIGGNMYNDIKDLAGPEGVGGEIGKKIDAATEAGQQVDLTQEVPAVLAKLKDIKTNGGKQAAAHAAEIEAQINKVLGLKPAKGPMEGLEGIEAPEGLDVEAMKNPASEEPKQILVDPKKALSLKQILQDFSPQKGMDAAEIESSRAAKELKGQTAEKINEATGVDEPGENGEPSLNEQYGGLKDALKRLKVNEKQLPNDIQDKITKVLRNLGKENGSGDDARGVIKDVIDSIKQVDPEVAAKYEAPLNDAVEKLQLASGNDIKYRGPIGTIVHAANPAANLAGVALNKLGANKLAQPLAGAANATKNFANTVLKEQAGRTGASVSEGATALPKASVEPYQLQRQVASASEKSDPETLKSQAGQIRSQYGQTGERLATQLERMSEQNRDARRALMFTILQDPNNRKMLGLSNGQER